jgi:proteasome lid subunit RPN8/RPN11
MEVGGILVGSRINGTVRLVEARPLVISYARGAAFLLTDGDYEALDRLIHKTNAEVAPKGLEAIGYYESHTRRDAALSEVDIETYDTRFDQPSAVCMILKPNNENGTIVNVYIRDSHGEIVQTELEGHSVHYKEAPVPEPTAASVSEPLAYKPEAVQPSKLEAEPYIPGTPVRTQPSRRRTYAILFVALAMGAAILLIMRIRSLISGPPPPLPNTVQQQPAGPPAPTSNANVTSESAPTQNATVSSSSASKRKKAARNRRARSQKQIR